MASEIAIKVSDVSKTFKLPHEKNSSIKGAVINFYRRNKSYETQEALKNISFEVKKGDFFGIVGRNGSGKSTLLKLLAGIYTPSKGNIAVHGKLTPFIELGVGFNQELSGRENVFLNGALLGFSRKEMGEMYDDIVEFSEIERFMDQKLKNYSSGMQVRLAFSIAIRARTDILLLDEVLAVGDAAFQQKCFDYFEELKRRKTTVVFVTHDMGAVRRFCNKAIYIDNGNLTHIGTPAEIADVYLEENLESARQASEKQSDEPGLSDRHRITGKITEQSEGKIIYEVSYDSKESEELYIGIAVSKDGISVAEIITSLEKPLTGKGKISYTLDTDVLNAGLYQLSAALFGMRNKNLLTYTKKKSDFTIKGSDPTKGSAIKLADNWTY